jgi:hypothetical protein
MRLLEHGSAGRGPGPLEDLSEREREILSFMA